MKRLLILAVLLLLPLAAFAGPLVLIQTSAGDIKVELDEEKAPLTVKNFLDYVDSGHYAGTTFHRVIADFMIQGGGLTADLKPKATKAPVRNEAGNGLKNLRGTIAMARGGAVDSATCQFFINLKDNPFLDHRDNSPGGFGYAVFGTVVDGIKVVDKIGNAKTENRNAVFRDVPVETVTIKGIKRVEK